MHRLFVPLTTLLFLACGSSSSAPSAACTPGAQVACACPGGVQGAQACKDDGSGFGVCACTNGAGGASGASGGSGGGGASGMAGARAALFFKVARAQDEKYMCPKGGEGRVGVVDGETKTEVANGESGATIACSVVPGGAGYQFNATFVQAHTSFSVSGTLSGLSGTASITLATQDIINPLTSASSAPCVLTVDPADGTGLGVGPGRIYAGFTCPLVQDPQDASPDVDGCGIIGVPPTTGVTPPGGYFALDGCTD